MNLDALIEHFEFMEDNIEDDVNEVVRNVAIDGASIAKNNAKRVMNKGYWTGNLWREIESAKAVNYHIKSHQTPAIPGSWNLERVIWRLNLSCGQHI